MTINLEKAQNARKEILSIASDFLREWDREVDSMQKTISKNKAQSTEELLIEIMATISVRNSFGDRFNLLVQELGVNEIILAYDKEYDEPYSPQGRMYREKLIQKCERYRGLANFYYIFDEHNLLDKKDAPCDKGQEVLETLMKRRIKIK